MPCTAHQYDVFISYAHLDNEPEEGANGWVTDFVRRLRRALNAYLGAEAEIFFDTIVNSGNVTLEALERAAANSAILIGIGSPSYAARPWLKKELDAFRATCTDNERLFLIERLRVPKTPGYPPPMNRKIGKRFWEQKEFEAADVPISATDPRYNAMVLDVAKRVQEQLEPLRTDRNAKLAAGVATGDKPAQRVLIAQGTDDVVDQIDEVRRYLQQFPEFVTVLPADEYPQGGAEFAAAFAKDLATADFFVQLLGNAAGRRTWGIEQGYTRFQLEEAQKAKVPVVQWRSTHLRPEAITNEAYRSLVEEPKVVVSGLEEFKAALLERARTPVAVAERTPSQVFVNTDRDNVVTARSVRRQFEEAKYTVSMPLLEGSTGEARKHLYTQFNDCGVIFFVNGSDDPAWLDTQKRTFDTISRKRAKPPRSAVVCTVPPGERPAEDFLGKLLKEIDCSAGYDSALVRDFIKTLVP
ncbi:TIR domain-containing protein [Sphingomonas sp. CARO-RG-8B-R24-01]|uniref:TIR domain-containing protein n=1 Tax=Sphingomonas sp. CARO-RG-8B-R24-01 TaxID=2914831 RepID=UPI001F58EEC6|nr:TIR domain-containing protein [Sphingomonas sp. CARO-RG-8B-R24-01]